MRARPRARAPRVSTATAARRRRAVGPGGARTPGGDPSAGAVAPTAGPLSLQYVDPAAVAGPAAGTFANQARNARYGPGGKGGHRGGAAPDPDPDALPGDREGGAQGITHEGPPDSGEGIPPGCLP